MESQNCKKSQSISNYDSSQNVQPIQDAMGSNPKFHYLSEIQTFQENYEKSALSLLGETSTQRTIREQSRFQISSTFSKKLKSFIIETNFQSAKVLLHYGFYKLFINVVYTKLSPNMLFGLGQVAKGSFGEVRILKFQGLQFAIKNVQLGKNSFESLLNIYEEFFLTCFAETLQIGPKMHKLFGYDIVVTQTSAFFVMEECFSIFHEKFVFSQSCMNESLKLAHECKFIHNDIKPENIAFSPSFNKNVFIDFGLSSFIQESEGQKTLTRFRGTVQFSSEEMKKCFWLQKQMEIDLYKNDKQALQKSTLIFLKQKERLLKKNNFKSPFQVHQLKTEYQNLVIDQNFIFSIIIVLKLKFQIENKSVDRVLGLLKKCHQLPQTCLAILSNQETNRIFLQNKQIKEILVQNHQKILRKVSKNKNIDEFISSYFDETTIETLSHKIIKIGQIVSLGEAQFKKVLQKQEMVHQLFIIFDPLQAKKISKLKNLLTMRKTICSKIYEATHKNEEESEFQWFYEKVFVLVVFFYERMKEMKNRRTLQSLRILFICLRTITIINYVSSLQNLLYSLIDDPILKILKFIEYKLFWEVFTSGHSKGLTLDPSKLKKLDPQNYGLIGQKVNLLADKVTGMIFEEPVWKSTKNSALALISQLECAFGESEHKDCLQSIRVLLLTDDPLLNNFKTNNIASEIYLVIIPKQRKKSKFHQVESLLQILSICPSKNYEKFSRGRITNPKGQIAPKIDDIITKSKSGPFLPGCRYAYLVQNGVGTRKEFIMFVADKLMCEDIEYIDKNEFKIFVLLNHGFCLVDNIRINKLKDEKLRLTMEETKQVYAKINKWLNYIHEVEAVEIRDRVDYQIIFSLLLLSLSDDIQEKMFMLSKIISIVQPKEFLKKEVANHLFLFFYSNQKDFSRKVICSENFNNMCQRYLQQESFLPFEFIQQSLFVLVKVKIALNKIEECFHFIVSFLIHLSLNRGAFHRADTLYSQIYHSCQFFCAHSSTQDLLAAKKQINEKYSHFICVEMEFLKISVFLFLVCDLKVQQIDESFHSFMVNLRDDEHFFYTEIRSCILLILGEITAPKKDRQILNRKRKGLKGSAPKQINKEKEYVQFAKRLVRLNVHKRIVATALNAKLQNFITSIQEQKQYKQFQLASDDIFY